MKISFIGPHLKVAGGPRIILEYASRLSLRGHDVTVYVRSNNPFRRTVANFFHLGYPKWIRNFRARVVRVSAYTTTTISDGDVVIATTHDTAIAIADFPKAQGRQFYLLQHDEGLYHGDRETVDRAYSLPQQKIVVATWLQELLREKYHQDAALLINPIDKSLFFQIKRTINDGTIRVLLLDHTYVWKGTKEGVEIVLELKKKYPHIRLVGYGVRKQISEFAFDEYHYNLPQEKLLWLYSNVDIFLCPSWDEGFGLPSVEAMACGVALATYDNGGSRDFAHHGVTAMVAPNRDKIALRERLEALVSDDTLRERIAGEGQKFVSTMPSWNERVMELEKILSQTK